MIDLHSHILAGVDDGANSLDDSMQLIEGSIADGVVKVLATPHIHIGTFDNDLKTIQYAFQQLIQRLISEKIKISIAYAAEVRICPEIMILAKSNALPFMGKWQGTDLLLLEFPHSHIPLGSEKLIDWLIRNNITVMIAHPERNRDVWQSPDVLNAFKERGCLFQITAASLEGDFGELSKSLAWQMIEDKTATIVASDMHNIKRRPTKMKDAFTAIDKRFGRDIAQKLLVETPDLIFKSNPTLWTNL